MKDYDTSGASVERLLENAIAISEKTADGTYYVYNELCAQIAEVDEEYLSFLSWESTSWVETAFFPIPLAYVTGIDLTSATTEIRFRMDNSRSDQSEGYDSTDINIKGEDKNGNSFDSWGCMTFYCSQTGNGKTINSTWRITPTEFSVRNTDTGERLRFTGDNETAINAFGETVQVISTPLVTTDGSRVTVGADYITVVKDGETVKYPRYTVQNFRQFYKALMYATLEGSADLSEADPRFARGLRTPSGPVTTASASWCSASPARTRQGKTLTASGKTPSARMCSGSTSTPRESPTSRQQVLVPTETRSLLRLRERVPLLCPLGVC